jgi:hypothetical protein
MDFGSLFDSRGELHEQTLDALNRAVESPFDRRLAEVAIVSSEPRLWEPYVYALAYARAAEFPSPAAALEELAERVASGEAPPVEVPTLAESLSVGPEEFAGGIRTLALHFADVGIVNSAASVDCIAYCLTQPNFLKCLEDEC